MPYWPPERYLELAPAYWVETRRRLDPAELGHSTRSTKPTFQRAPTRA